MQVAKMSEVMASCASNDLALRALGRPQTAYGTYRLQELAPRPAPR